MSAREPPSAKCGMVAVSGGGLPTGSGCTATSESFADEAVELQADVGTVGLMRLGDSAPLTIELEEDVVGVMV